MNGGINTNSREGKEVKLRCIIKRNNSEYVGVCLELGLVIKVGTLEDGKKKLNQAIEEYIDTVAILIKQGRKVRIRPVKFYWAKRVLFDATIFILNLCTKDGFEAGFIKKMVVPVAA